MKRNPETLRAWQRRSREAARARELEKRRARSFVKKPPKPRKTLRQHSPKRSAEMRLYYAERRAWLALPKNSVCAICLCLGKPIPNCSSEVHHSRGRIRRLLRYQPFWVASCRSCRSVPHDNPKWARSVGILSESKDWEVFPTP